MYNTIVYHIISYNVISYHIISYHITAAALAGGPLSILVLHLVLAVQTVDQLLGRGFV